MFLAEHARMRGFFMCEESLDDIISHQIDYIDAIIVFLTETELPSISELLSDAPASANDFLQS